MQPSDASLDNTRRIYDLIARFDIIIIIIIITINIIINIIIIIIIRPLDNIPTIHVGGTNGKGSTCYKISEALISQGLKTGLFVSPHICSYRERIQINGTIISEEHLVKLAPLLLSLIVDNRVPLTLFEVI